MRAGRPRSRGDLLPLMGWGDGRVGAGDRYFFMNIDAQDAQDLVLGVWCLAILGIRNPPPDHRPSRLPVQQPLVLFILCILCIDVNNPFCGGPCR